MASFQSSVLHLGVASIGVNLLSVLIGTILGYEYKRRRKKATEQEEEKEQWYNDVLGILGEANHNVRRARIRSDIDIETVGEDFADFSNRLNRKVQNPADGVPKAAIRDMEQVVPVFAKGSAVAEVSSQKEGVKAISEMFEMAQREFSTELDLQEAIQTAGDSSSLFGALLTSMEEEGIETEDFAEGMEEIMTEYTQEDFQHFLSLMHSGADVEETIELVNRIFLQLTDSISRSGYEAIKYYRANEDQFKN